MKNFKGIMLPLIVLLIAVAVGWYAGARGFGLRRIFVGEMSDEQARDLAVRIARAQGLTGIANPHSIAVSPDPTILGCGFTEFAIPVQGINLDMDFVSLVICCTPVTETCYVRYRLP